MFTGPSKDISGNGCYLYVDATEPAQENDVALMSTPFIKGNCSQSRVMAKVVDELHILSVNKTQVRCTIYD